MPPTLESRVEAAVAAVLEQRNGTVEQLIGQALDRRLGELVAAELEARAETSVRSDEQRSSDLASDRKTCRACGVLKPVSEYERDRGTCRACRRRQERERAARRAGAEPEG